MANKIKGLRDLERKLEKLGKELGVKTSPILEDILYKSTIPFLNKMKADIPVGTQQHRTYTKRLVQPGFAKRSIRQLTGTRDIGENKLSVATGVRAEAYYAIQFYDRGPYTITRRRQSTNIKAKGHFGNQRRNIMVKPYTLKKHPFFVENFILSQSTMIKIMRKQLKDQVEALAKKR